MVKDFTSVWNNCLKSISENVTEKTFNTWFKPIKAVHLENQTLIVKVPHKFNYEYIEENYLPLLKEAIQKELGDKARLEYQIVVGNNTSKERSGSSKDYGLPGSISPDKIQNPFVIPGIKKVKFNPQLSEALTFNNFIEGDCNQLARAAGVAISNNPGGTQFNPLFIYGDVGLGKTHLAQAIGNQIVEKHPNKNVLYVTLEKFTNQFIQSIKNGASADFVNFYQLVDVLIIDDIQYLKGKEKTQEVFFNIFNHLYHSQGKQMIFTSDRAPKDLEGLEDRMISRFKWGLTSDLKAPDYETRLAILESKMSMENIEIPKEVTEIICHNIDQNVRELEGVIIQLIAQASLNQKKIDEVLARQVIQSFINKMDKEVTIDNIKQLVAGHYNMDVELLSSKSRRRDYVVPRQISMYFSRKITGTSLKAIGSEFGGRDHTTVLHAMKAVENLIDTDVLFKENMEKIQSKISLSLG